MQGPRREDEWETRRAVADDWSKSRSGCRRRDADGAHHRPRLALRRLRRWAELDARPAWRAVQGLADRALWSTRCVEAGGRSKWKVLGTQLTGALGLATGQATTPLSACRRSPSGAGVRPHLKCDTELRGGGLRMIKS